MTSGRSFVPESPKASNRTSLPHARRTVEVQRIDHMAPIVAEQLPTPVVVMRVTGVAVVGDGFIRAGRIFARDDMRVLERYGGHAARTETMSPVQSQVRLVCQPIEPAA